MNTTLLVKIGLAALSVVFTGFAVDNLFPAAELGDDLLAMGAVGLGLAALIFP